MEIRDFWKATLRQDAASMRRFFAPGARVFWHNTNEAFSAEEFIEVNCEYPGAWDGEVERVERIGGLIVTALRVFARHAAFPKKPVAKKGRKAGRRK